MIRAGIDGFLVDAGDAGALADKLALLAHDPARRAEMGAEGRASVLERYAVARLVDDVDLLYRSLLAGVEPGKE